MSTPPRTSLLRRLIGRPAPAVVDDDDAADMGTAIGLDYSLDQRPLTLPEKAAPSNQAVRQPWPRRRQPF